MSNITIAGKTEIPTRRMLLSGRREGAVKNNFSTIAIIIVDNVLRAAIFLNTQYV
jgi:hypothetical protein